MQNTLDLPKQEVKEIEIMGNKKAKTEVLLTNSQAKKIIKILAVSNLVAFAFVTRLDVPIIAALKTAKVMMGLDVFYDSGVTGWHVTTLFIGATIPKLIHSNKEKQEIEEKKRTFKY